MWYTIEMDKVLNFFDRLEDYVRGVLSKAPIIYSLLGGAGVILFWRGLWHTADFLQTETWVGSVLFSGPGSLFLGLAILLITGLFVSVFIGESIVMSGIKSENKLTEKTESEVNLEREFLINMDKELKHIEKDLHMNNSTHH